MNNVLEKLIKKLREAQDEEGLKLLLKAISDEDLKGMSVVDDPDEGGEDDAAAEWLKAQEKKGEDKPKKVSSRDWQAPENLTEEQKKAVEEHLQAGHSEREAHRFAGTHKEHQDLQQAMESGINPSMMSDKMLETLKPLAQQWMEQADKHEKLTADIEKNPMKHASGRLMEAHEKHTADYNKAYHDFLNSDEVKNLSGMKRHKAIREWKKNYKEQNPDYEKGLSNIAEAQSTFDTARTTSKKNLQEKMEHIMRGGVSAPGMSATEASQHLGQDVRGEQAPQVGTEDISSSFAAKNPKLVNLLNQEHMSEQKDRLNRIDSHAKAQGIVRRKKGEGGE